MLANYRNKIPNHLLHIHTFITSLLNSWSWTLTTYNLKIFVGIKCLVNELLCITSMQQECMAPNFTAMPMLFSYLMTVHYPTFGSATMQIPMANIKNVYLFLCTNTYHHLSVAPNFTAMPMLHSLTMHTQFFLLHCMY